MNRQTSHGYFYVGSSDRNLTHPIFLCKLDYETHEIGMVDSFAGSQSSSYLALSGDKKLLYAVDSRVYDTATREQSLSAFLVNPENFGLDYLNSQSSRGSGPCHIYCNPERSHVFVANYSSGSVAVFPLAESGEIQPSSDLYLSKGSGPNKNRQESAHTHYVSLDPDGNYLLSPDLGTDRILNFRFDKSSGKIQPNSVQPYFSTAPGAGPRHLDFHPDGSKLYLLNELHGTLTACRFDGRTGEITGINTLSTLPDDYDGSNKSAAVRVHPSGNFVYASNRGDLNSIAVFRIQGPRSPEGDGSIALIEVYAEIPDWPRDFNIDPTGRYLLVAGKQSNDIELFFIDKATGKLAPSGGRIDVPAPSNILFVGN